MLVADVIDRVTNCSACKSSNRDDITRVCCLQIQLMNSEFLCYFQDFRLFNDFTILANGLKLVSNIQLALLNTTNKHFAKIFVALSLVD
jgi:hypothetical protein